MTKEEFDLVKGDIAFIKNAITDDYGVLSARSEIEAEKDKILKEIEQRNLSLVTAKIFENSISSNGFYAILSKNGNADLVYVTLRTSDAKANIINVGKSLDVGKNEVINIPFKDAINIKDIYSMDKDCYAILMKNGNLYIVANTNFVFNNAYANDMLLQSNPVAKNIKEIYFSAKSATADVAFFALSNDGEVFASGDGSGYQLFSGSTANITALARMNLPSGVKKIQNINGYTGYGVSAALLENGDVYVSGNNYSYLAGTTTVSLNSYKTDFSDIKDIFLCGSSWSSTSSNNFNLVMVKNSGESVITGNTVGLKNGTTTNQDPLTIVDSANEPILGIKDVLCLQEKSSTNQWYVLCENGDFYVAGNNVPLDNEYKTLNVFNLVKQGIKAIRTNKTGKQDSEISKTNTNIFLECLDGSGWWIPAKTNGDSNFVFDENLVDEHKSTQNYKKIKKLNDGENLYFSKVDMKYRILERPLADSLSKQEFIVIENGAKSKIKFK